jgi:hypothetical protein
MPRERRSRRVSRLIERTVSVGLVNAVRSPAIGVFLLEIALTEMPTIFDYLIMQ